jgi:hypothetical protein
MTSEFIWRMEDIFDLYEQPYDPKRPVIFFDERPCQLIGDAIIPMPIKPGISIPCRGHPFGSGRLSPGK